MHLQISFIHLWVIYGTIISCFVFQSKWKWCALKIMRDQFHQDDVSGKRSSSHEYSNDADNEISISERWRTLAYHSFITFCACYASYGRTIRWSKYGCMIWRCVRYRDINAKWWNDYLEVHMCYERWLSSSLGLDPPSLPSKLIIWSSCKLTKMIFFLCHGDLLSCVPESSQIDDVSEEREVYPKVRISVGGQKNEVNSIPGFCVLYFKDWRADFRVEDTI